LKPNPLNYAYSTYRADPSLEATERLLAAVTSYAQRLVRRAQPQDADDVLQEIVLHVWKSLDRFAGRSSFKSWVHNICKNKLGDSLRRKYRESDQVNLSGLVIDTIEREDPGGSIHRRTSIHLTVLSPEEHRAVKVFAQHGDFESAAETLHTTPKALRSRLERIRVKCNPAAIR
jgi:RNA polymerase sigma-70 factor (ECF subfamily)